MEDIGFPVNRNEMRLKKVAQSAEYASITADSNIIELGRELGANNDSITGSTTTTGSNILITFIRLYPPGNLLLNFFFTLLSGTILLPSTWS